MDVDLDFKGENKNSFTAVQKKNNNGLTMQNCHNQYVLSITFFTMHLFKYEWTLR